MINIEDIKHPIKVENYLIAITECKTGRFSEFKKIVLSELIYMYFHINSNGELKIYDNKTYHFSFLQKDLASELKKDTKDMYRAMKWLQNEGYISYFAPKATYVTINEEFINSKIQGARNISVQNKKKIDNKLIPSVIEISEKEQSPVDESVNPLPPEITQIAKYVDGKPLIFNKEQLINYLLRDETVHYDEFVKKGFILQNFDYVNLVNAIWHIHKANQKKQSTESINQHKNAVKIISKIFQNKQDIQYYTKLIDTKLDKYKTD